MRHLILISFFLFGLSSLSQEAAMFFRENEMKLGEQTKFTLQLTYQDPDEDALIAWPQFDEMLTDHIEIIDRTVDFDEIVDTAEHIYIKKQEFTVSCFQPGKHVIQPIGIELNDSLYYTNQAQLLVHTVEIDTSKGVYDIKGNYAVEYTMAEKVEDWFKQYWPWLAGVGGLAALFLIFRFIQKRRPQQEAPAPPPVPAHVTALKKLSLLKKEEAWKLEDPKEFYYQLTLTVRRYLEQRFGIKAVERTTREIIKDLKHADISEEDKIYLRKILSEADMVKFAKFIPDETFGEQSLDKSIDFVERTKDEEENSHEENSKEVEKESE